MISNASKETTGTGKWAQPGVPHNGWECVGIQDLGEPSFTCEMCEVMVIRYVHRMRHADYPDELDCGCVCAGHMEDTTKAQERERWMHNVTAREKNWLKRAWRVARSGNHYLNTDGYNIVVFAKGIGWTYRIENEVTGAPIWSKRTFRSEKDAKLASFTGLISIKQSEYIVVRST